MIGSFSSRFDVRRCLAALAIALPAFIPLKSTAHDLRAFAIERTVTPNSCPHVAPATPFAAPPPGYIKKHQTIAHRFLDREAGVAQVTSAMYFILDQLIDEAIATLGPLTLDLPPAQARAQAVERMTAIDCILLRHGFVYPGHGLVGLLSDGLGPTRYEEPEDRRELRGQTHNVRRQRFIDALGEGPFHVADCDIASYVYLAIGEVMHYPLHLVEIPRHNFVRWELGAGAHFNFETMDGIETDDDYYKRNWAIHPTFADRGGILQSMREKETIAYHLATVGISWSWQSNIPEMLKAYRESVAVDASHALALNNLAWFYAGVPKPEWRDGTPAVEYGLRAAALLPDGDVLDTLACAYAQAGDFDRAIETERAAIKALYTPFGSDLAGDLALFQASPPQTCNDPTFGKDPAPFRPGRTIARAATGKDLSRLH